MSREKANMAQRYEHEIPEGCEARIEGNKVIIELKESEDEKFARVVLDLPFKHEADYKFVRAYLEKQKEAQPGDEDRYMEGYMNGINDALKRAEPAEYPEKGNEYWFGFNNGKGTVLDNPEQFGLYRPAEWSEEDKRAIDRACVALRAYSNGDLPEFLPSELLGYADRLQALLLHPHWKPSEEQMGALNYAYCELFKRGDVGHNILGPFQSLIDTLRKL